MYCFIIFSITNTCKTTECTSEFSFSGKIHTLLKFCLSHTKMLYKGYNPDSSKDIISQILRAKAPPGLAHV